MLRHSVVSNLPVKVRKEFIGASADVDALIIALEFYAGSVPTFTIKSESGHIFSYLPSHAFAYRQLDQYVDIECPASSPSVTILPLTSEKGGWGRIHRTVVAWRQYVCSIDWEKENLLIHCVVLEDGGLAFIRNSRFQVGGTEWNPPSWKKLRNDWDLSNRDVCLIVRRGNLYLAVSRKGQPHLIGLPAGKIECNESPLEAAARELKEETGLILTSATMLDEREWRGRKIYCFFAATEGDVEDAVSLSGRGEGVAGWVDKQSLFDGPFGEYNKAIFDEYRIGAERN